MAVTVTIRVPASKEALDILLEGLVELNVAFLQRNPRTPLLYDAGVRYKKERPGRERWLRIPQLYKKGVGDCEDLGAALAGEYRFAGADAVAFSKRTGEKTFHTLVAVDGRIEDPSRVLGMGKKKRWRASSSR